MRPRRLIGLATAAITLLGGQTLLALSSAEAAPASAPAPAPAPAKGAERALRAAAEGPVTVRRNAAGDVTFVGTAAGRPVDRPAGLSAGAAPTAVARAHLDRYGALFGVRDQADELRTDGVTKLGRGRSAVRFQQTAAGLPVLGGELVTVVENDGDLVSVNGETARSVRSTQFGVSSRTATRAALLGTARRHGVPVSDLTSSAPAPWLYDASLVGPSSRAGAGAVWRLEVRSRAGEPIRQLVLVDASTGGLALSFNQVAHAKERAVCNFGNQADPDFRCPHGIFDVDRSEGQAATGVAAVDNAYDYTGATYDFFFDRFGRDSLDAAGMPLVSTVNFCPSSSAQDCPYDNAFWFAGQATFGQGYANADDVVAHELSHGLTEHMSDLLYYYQSGAINESMSDVFGELIDQTNGLGDDSAAVKWEIGEDLAPPLGLLRNMRSPSLFDQPSYTSSAAWDSLWVDAGGVHINSGVGNKAAQLMVDGGDHRGRTVSALGVDKVAQLYYSANGLLTSGGDYRDLYNVLNQACQSLVGTTPKDANGDPSSAGPFTAADCTEVNDATLAVEMNVHPANDPPLPATPGTCPTGTTKANRLSDTFEESLSTNWTRSGTDDWTANESYQTSVSPGRALFGNDTDFGPVDDPDPVADRSRWVATKSAFQIASGRKTYVRFDHAYSFDFFGPGIENPPGSGQEIPPEYYDGGFVEVNDGSGWKRLIVQNNGYDERILATSDQRFGFAGDSTDWITSRADLSSYAGKSVRVRFRIITDGISAVSAAYGWWIDDFALYSCTPPGAPRSVAVQNISRPRAKMTWAAAVPNSGFSIKNYVVKRSGATARTLPSSARSFVWSGLTKGKTYTFTIYAKNNAGAQSATVSRSLRIT